MLIYCPDCKRKLSSDCEVCRGCGCKISEIPYEALMGFQAKTWDPLGIISAVISLPSFLIRMIIGVTVAEMMYMHTDFSGAACFIAWIMLSIVPIIQIILGTVSLNRHPEAHRWPAVLGIVLGSIIELFWTFAIVAIYMAI